jgi:hypothetical protein
MRRPAQGQRRPPNADIRAAQREPPQQRALADHVENDTRTGPADRRVIQREHLVVAVLRELEQRQVPTVVDGEELSCDHCAVLGSSQSMPPFGALRISCTCAAACQSYCVSKLTTLCDALQARGEP